MCNPFWHYCVTFFACVTQSGVILIYIFRVWNALWHYRVILSAPGTRSVFIVMYISACGTCSGVNVLYFSFERALAIFCYFVSEYETRSGVIVSYFSAHRKCSGIFW